jgi:hypothetical protein
MRLVGHYAIACGMFILRLMSFSRPSNRDPSLNLYKMVFSL